MSSEAASYLKAMDSTQEELLSSMDETVSRGTSVLNTFTAKLYMDRLLGEIEERLTTDPTTLPEYICAMAYVSGGEMGHDAEKRVITRKILPMACHLGISDVFPRESLPFLYYITEVDELEFPFGVDVTVGALSGALPLTRAEQEHLEQARVAMNSYMESENFSNLRGRINTRDERLSKQRERTHNLWMAMAPLLHLNPNHGTENMMELLSQSGFSTPEDAMFSDLALIEENNFALLVALARRIESPEDKNALLRDTFNQLSPPLEQRLLTQLGIQEVKALSLLPLNKLTYYSAAGIASQHVLSDKIHGVMSKYLPTMTWEQLMGFAALVEEYNVDWALASYDWKNTEAVG